MMHLRNSMVLATLTISFFFLVSSSFFLIQAEAGRPKASPSWVRYCIVTELTSEDPTPQWFNRIAVTQGFPNHKQRFKYGTDQTSCQSSQGQCVNLNMPNDRAPCIVGSLTPFEGGTLICESFNSQWGYAYSKCNDNTAMSANQGPVTFQYYQPIGYFKTHSGGSTCPSGCGCNPGVSFMNLQGFLAGSDNHVKAVINLWTGGGTPLRSNPQQSGSSLFNAYICGWNDFPKVASGGVNLGTPITTSVNGSVHIFDNSGSPVDLTINLSEAIETSVVKATQVDTSSSSSTSKSFGWSTELSASTSAEFAGVGVEFSVSQSFEGNEEVSQEVTQANSASSSDSVTIQRSLTGELTVPSHTRIKLTEIVTTTILRATAAYTLTDPNGGTTPEAVGLMSSTTATSGYYVEAF